jgi:gliding motility-associated lipoprotein GldD
MKFRNKSGFLVLLSAMMLMAACSEPPVPRPRAFFRIELPPKEYRLFNENYPYSFEYPIYAEINRDLSPLAEPHWLNIDFTRFQARIHLSYKPVDNNLGTYLDDFHRLLHKQIPKATAIRDDVFSNADDRVYGIVFQVRGLGVASTNQFFATDSINHYLRGALYFNVIPNNDSLAPVIEFLNEDIQHFMKTLRWND